METTSCFGGEGFAGRGEQKERRSRDAIKQLLVGKASVNQRQPLPLFPVDGISELPLLSATMLQEQDVTEAGGWVVYFDLTRGLG